MAGITDTKHRPAPASQHIQHLRQLAQSNLVDIEIKDQAEADQQIIVARDLRKYAKVKRTKVHQPFLSLPTTPTSSSSTEQTQLNHQAPPITTVDTVKCRLRPVSDVLDRIRHDPSLDITQYHVGYLERFDGIKEMPVRNWIREYTDEEWIPQHRIRYVKRRWFVTGEVNEEVVWDRDERVDSIFGSGWGRGVTGSKGEIASVSDLIDGQSEVGGVFLT